MEKIIRTLKEMRDKSERLFIDNSLIVYRTKSMDSPIPDTQSDLEMIEELNRAISILENAQKPVNSQQ